MATVELTTATRNLLCNALTATHNSGKMSLRKADETVVAEPEFGNPAFDGAGAAGGNAPGKSVAEAIADDTVIATELIAHCTLLDSVAAEIGKLDVGLISAGTASVQLSAVDLTIGDVVSITSFEWEQPSGV